MERKTITSLTKAQNIEAYFSSTREINQTFDAVYSRLLDEFY